MKILIIGKYGDPSVEDMIGLCDPDDYVWVEVEYWHSVQGWRWQSLQFAHLVILCLSNDLPLEEAMAWLRQQKWEQSASPLNLPIVLLCHPTNNNNQEYRKVTSVEGFYFVEVNRRQVVQEIQAADRRNVLREMVDEAERLKAGYRGGGG